MERLYVYESVIREVVDELTPYLRQVDAAQVKPLKVRVVADRNDDPDYWCLLKAAFFRLRSKDGSGMVKSVKPGKAASSNFLQVADLICGATRWNEPTYRKLISTQCLGIRSLP
jgi:hypothetical protein